MLNLPFITRLILLCFTVDAVCFGFATDVASGDTEQSRFVVELQSQESIIRYERLMYNTTYILAPKSRLGENVLTSDVPDERIAIQNEDESWSMEGKRQSVDDATKVSTINFADDHHGGDAKSNSQVFWASSSDGEPEDPEFRYQWALPRIGAPEAWRQLRSSYGAESSEVRPVIVCIIDSGLDPNHEDLKDNLHPDIGYDAVLDSNEVSDTLKHGTHVAGIVAAVTNNSLDISGVGNNYIQVLSCTFLNKNGYGYIEDAVSCINYCIDMKSDVISNSYSGEEPNADLEKAIERANENDILFIAAAGNTATDLDLDSAYPASYGLQYPNIIVVASTNFEDKLSDFSNYGLETVDLAAPGEWILSTTPFNETGYSSGTSMAVPFVAGAAALVMRESNFTLTAAETKEIILDTVEILPSLEDRIASGGILRIDKAIELAKRVNSSDSTRAGQLEVVQTKTARKLLDKGIS